MLIRSADVVRANRVFEVPMHMYSPAAFMAPFAQRSLYTRA